MLFVQQACILSLEQVTRIYSIAIETELMTQYISNVPAGPQREELENFLASKNPMVQPGDEHAQSSDVAGVCAFLCGKDSKFINGALIPVDGGYHCL